MSCNENKDKAKKQRILTLEAKERKRKKEMERRAKIQKTITEEERERRRQRARERRKMFTDKDREKERRRKREARAAMTQEERELQKKRRRESRKTDEHREKERQRKALYRKRKRLEEVLKTPESSRDHHMFSDHFSEDEDCQSNRTGNDIPDLLYFKKTAIPKAETPGTGTQEVSCKEENTPTPVTCSAMEDNSWFKAIRSPLTPQGSNTFRSREVSVNAQCLLELFQFCRLCQKECCIAIEGNERLFSVTQDCQSCGFHRDWTSHPPSAEPTQTFHDEEEHALKQEDDEEVMVQIMSSDNECSERFIEKDGSCLSSDDDETSQEEEEEKKKSCESKDSSDEWEPWLNEEATDCVPDEDLLTVLKTDGEGKLLVWCTQCETEASHFCSVLQHKKLFCCVQCHPGDNLRTKFETLPVWFDDIVSFQMHAEQEHGVKPSFIPCRECGKLVRAEKQHECEDKI